MQPTPSLSLEIASAVLLLVYVLLVIIDWSIRGNGLARLGDLQHLWELGYATLTALFLAAFVAEQATKACLFGFAYFRETPPKQWPADLVTSRM